MKAIEFMRRLLTPVIKPPVGTRHNRALVQVGERVFRINHRELERNKYAPWGRGIHSGLPQGE